MKLILVNAEQARFIFAKLSPQDRYLVEGMGSFAFQLQAEGAIVLVDEGVTIGHLSTPSQDIKLAHLLPAAFRREFNDVYETPEEKANAA